ncbi:MAG: right-handed parallel beta-helix repeat-containing protein [Verrucomicrobiales bacterium]
MKLDRILQNLYLDHGDFAEGVHIRFLEGTFLTAGISVRPNWHIEGVGIDRTTIKRVATSLDQRSGSENYSVISGGWAFTPIQGQPVPSEKEYKNIKIEHLTLDANWSGMRKELGAQVKKTQGLSIVAAEAEIAYVKVIHSGAHGGREVWQETFPIAVGGRGRLLPDEMKAEFANSRIEIHHCVVEGRIEGPERRIRMPYGTGIMVSQTSKSPNEGDIYAHIHDNLVQDVPNGIGFGGAYMKSALYENNRVVRCGSGFVFDTGGNSNVKIRNNSFEDCVGGGRIVNASNFSITSNVFNIVYDEKGLFSGWNYGLRILDYTSGFEILNNKIRTSEILKKDDAVTGGIVITGRRIGYLLVPGAMGGLVRLPVRHRIAENEIDALLPNQADSLGDWIYLSIDGQDVDLSGTDIIPGNQTFKW